MNIRHFKIAFRKIQKAKFIFFVNVIGLAIGLASFTFILFYIDFEKGYDSFHSEAEDIYRVESLFYPIESPTDEMATSSFGYGPAMQADIAEVKSYCRINMFRSDRDLKYKDIVHREEFVVYADSNFFSFFSFPLVRGNKYNVLSEPNTLVLSERMATKYFGRENPIGKNIEVNSDNNTRNYTVTGVFKDVNPQSHIQFDILLAYPYQNNWINSTWYMHEAYTYVKVRPENVKTVETRFTEISKKYATLPALSNKTWAIELKPLQNIHLSKARTYEHETKGNSNAMRFLHWVSIILIIASWANYINIASSKNLELLSDMEIFRFHGARFNEVLKLLFAETFTVCLIAFLLSVALLSAIIPFTSGLGASFNFLQFWSTPQTWLILIGISLLGLIITNSIPSVLLHQLQRKVFKIGQRNTHIHTGKLREALVTIQFAASIVLIVFTLMVHKQNQYLQNINLGVDIDRTIIIKSPTYRRENDAKLVELRKQLLTFANIKNATISSAIPGKSVLHLSSNRNPASSEIDNKLHEMLKVDYNYIPMYDLEILEGRNFSKQYGTDNTAVVINETSRELFGFESNLAAIGKTVLLEGQGDRQYTVIGVLKDFHHMSAKEVFQPIVMINSTYHNWIRNNYVSVKLQSDNFKEDLAKIEQTYNSFFEGNSFNYFFLDESFDRQFKSDIKFGKVFTLFTWLGIVIVCLGLLGLTNFILIKQTKEIGVRKVNGAKTLDVLAMINKSFIYKLLIAFIIACPVSYYALMYWLETFAQRTNISWWVYATGGSLSLLISIITVTIMSYQTANRNPVESLRYE